MLKIRAALAVFATLAVGTIVGTYVVDRFRPQPEVEIARASAIYAMNVVVSGVPFWRDTRSTWTAAGLVNPSVRTVFGGPLNTDAQRQIEEVEALIAQKVDGLVLAPADSAALRPVIDKAASKGITVLTYLVDVPGSKRLAYVTSELESASLRVAKVLTAKNGPAGKAVISYAQPGNDEQEARRRGFEEFIAKNPQMEIVGVIQDSYDETKGADQLKALLVQHPDLKYVFGANSRSAIGAVTAARESGKKPGEILISGWDTDRDVLDLIKEGWVQASVAQQSSFMTSLMFGILEAKRLGFLYPAERPYSAHGIEPVPDTITVPVVVVTPQNVLGFYPRD